MKDIVKQCMEVQDPEQLLQEVDLNRLKAVIYRDIVSFLFLFGGWRAQIGRISGEQGLRFVILRVGILGKETLFIRISGEQGTFLQRTEFNLWLFIGRNETSTIFGAWRRVFFERANGFSLS